MNEIQPGLSSNGAHSSEDLSPVVMPTAEEVVEIKNRSAKEARRSDGSSEMILGGMLFVGGIGITIFSKFTAGDYGSYHVFLGAIIAGLVLFFVGAKKREW